MNREIKFRVWGKAEKHFTRLVEDKLYKSCYLSVSLLGGLEAKNEYGEDLEINESNFEVEQFTGLLDKNGREIYEGDVVKLNDAFKAEVRFGHGQFYPFPPQSENRLGCWGSIEILGNIFENPELLKV